MSSLRCTYSGGGDYHYFKGGEALNVHSLYVHGVTKRVRNVGSNSSFFRTNSLFCHTNSSSVIGSLHLGDEFDWNFDEFNAKRRNWFCCLVLRLTVTDEFELQLTKTGDKARNWMTMFQNWSTKTKLKRAFAHSKVFGTKLTTFFSKIEWRDDENGRENLYYLFMQKRNVSSWTEKNTTLY